jgi:hypothetical protein
LFWRSRRAIAAEGERFDRLDRFHAGGALAAIEEGDFAQHSARLGIIEHDLAAIGSHHADAREAFEHDPQRIARIALQHDRLPRLERADTAARRNIGQLLRRAAGQQAWRCQRFGERGSVHGKSPLCRGFSAPGPRLARSNRPPKPVGPV